MTAAEEPRTDEALPSGEALYLYCLARRDRLPAIDGAGSGDEHPMSISTFKDIVAVVGRVRIEEFSGAVAEERMKDLAWVGPRACRHEEVIERAMRSSPVVPARFATLFSSPESLAGWLAAHHEAISRALDRFMDHEEWAVKGDLDSRKAEAPLLAAALAREQTSPSSSPGARYLAERRIQAGIGRELEAWLKGARERVAGELVEHAAGFRERGATSEGSREGTRRVLNWAFLVPRRSFEEFADRIQRINDEYTERGLVLDLSGPWPPYSFSPPLETETSEALE